MRISDWSSDVCSSDLQGVAVIGKLGREPCRRTHRVEQLDHRHRVRRGLPVAVGCAPRDVICAQGVAEFGGKENHAAILPLACASCASWCLASNQSAALLAALAARKIARLSSRSEEHTSELQSLMRISYAVFCLKKKNTDTIIKNLYG